MKSWHSMSFRFSFKNADGGPGDAGVISRTSGNRAEGGEWGVNAFVQDGQGLSVGVVPYPAVGTNGVTARWGGQEFAFLHWISHPSRIRTPAGR